MKKILFLLVFISTTILGFSQIRLSGTVTDVFTKLPLIKAVVTVNGSDNTLITDEEGFFTVVLKESGVYDVEVSKNGYKSLVETLILNESIGLQIMLTSNAGTADPTYVANQTPKDVKYVDRESKPNTTENDKDVVFAAKDIKADKVKTPKVKPVKEPILVVKAEKTPKVVIEKEPKVIVEKEPKVVAVKEPILEEKITKEKTVKEPVLVVKTEKEPKVKPAVEPKVIVEKEPKVVAVKEPVLEEKIKKEKTVKEPVLVVKTENEPKVKPVVETKVIVEKEPKIVAVKEPVFKENNIIETSVVAQITQVEISGTVRDKITKETLGSVNITFDGMKNKFGTSQDGEFFINVPYKKDYFMIFTKEGYETISGNIPTSEKISLDIYLTKLEDLNIMEFTTNEVVISKTRATKNTPTTFTKIDKEDIADNNLGKDLPFLLELTPSVVATSDGGSGTGYTSMRVRGSDITRINFTLNGFPVNDPESQAVFLVNTPDLASSIDDIQIQRGIGTSTNGAGAFGASVNMNTNNIKTKPFAEINNSFGSFNTFKNTIKLGTGSLFNHFTFDGRFSHISTKGYIDRAKAKLFSYALNATYYTKRSSIRFNVFNGHERTYQAWNGVDYNTMQTNRKFNSAGTDYGQITIPYNNEIDDYDQQNYQLSFSHNFGKGFSADIGLHYTKGKGYFEQYKVGEDLLDYGILSTSATTDLVRRRWLDNQFFGTIFGIKYKKEKIDVTLGGGWNQYDGNHFGEIIWTKDGNGLTKDEMYYFNNGLKTDFNTYLKAEYTVLKRLVLFADIQYRQVNYTADGIDNDQKEISEDVDYHFVNPKAGVTVLLGKEMRSQLYASFAMANREPTRNDFIDNAAKPKPENMMDVEFGFRHSGKKLSYAANAFYMHYKNQLVLTGELNDVGSAVRANVDKSFRTGIELEIAYEPIKYFGVSAAGAWSLNEIKSFSFTNYNGDVETHDKTKIAYSPALVGNFTLYTKPFKGFELALINKYVSEQFLDNTNSKSKILNPYFLNDARISYAINPKFMQQVEFIVKANNILNVKYASNGYVYYDTPYFYPQAGTNFEVAVNLKF